MKTKLWLGLGIGIEKTKYREHVDTYFVFGFLKIRTSREINY